MIRPLALAALAAVTLALAAFVLVETRSRPTPPPTSPTTEPSPSAPASAVPTARASSANSQPSTLNSQPPPPPPRDPLDTVINGKTRRQWHAYYADRQQQMLADIERYQQIVTRAERGEEPDPRELGDAHDRIRELRERLKQDLEALQQIDATP
jgi:hypothetical protein